MRLGLTKFIKDKYENDKREHFIEDLQQSLENLLKICKEVNTMKPEQKLTAFHMFLSVTDRDITYCNNSNMLLSLPKLH